MTENKIKNVWPEWEIVGELGSGTHGRSYLAKKTVDDGKPLYRTIKEVQITPQKGAVQTAIDLGISVEALEDYFDVFKGDMDWELNIYRLADSDKLSKNEEFVLVDSDVEPGWTGYVRRDLYTPINEFYGDKPTGENEAVRIGKDICEALVACEDMYMVHGGVSYSNVLVDDNGKAVLVDYGVNRCTSKAGVKLFAPIHQFDAPEVIADGDYTKYSDIYSLGMTLISIANGGVLTSSKNLKNVFSPRFAEIIEKAVAKNSWERYRSAGEMLDDLSKIGTYQSAENGKSAVQQALLDAHGSVIRVPRLTPKGQTSNKRRIIIAVPRIDRLNGESVRLEPKIVLKSRPHEPETKTAPPVIDVTPRPVAPYGQTGISPEQELAIARAARQQAQDALFSHAAPEKDQVTEYFKPIEELFNDSQPEPEPELGTLPYHEPEQVIEVQPEDELEDEPEMEELPETATELDEQEPEQPEQTGEQDDLHMFFGEKADPLADGGAEAEAAESRKKSAVSDIKPPVKTESEGEKNNIKSVLTDWRVLAAAGIVVAASLLVIVKPWNRSVRPVDTETPPAVVQTAEEQQAEDQEAAAAVTEPVQPETTEEQNAVETVDEQTSEPETVEEQPTEPETVDEHPTEPETVDEQPAEVQTSAEEEPDPTAEFLKTYTAPEYIFDQRVISESELEGKGKIETSILINSIYARHGKVFENPALQAYFEAQPWYTANDSDRDYTEEFTRTEVSNMNILTKYQKKMGYR